MRKLNLLSGIDFQSGGWIKSVRMGLGMSQEQLGRKLGITRQSVQELETREKKGSISIKTMREVAKALEMEVVYGFTSKEGSLEAMIEKKANELATRIVMRTAQSMKLEDQGNSAKRLKNAIKERAEIIKQQMPKILWD